MPYRRRRWGRYQPVTPRAARPPKPPVDPIPGLRREIEKIYAKYEKLVVSTAEDRANALIPVFEPLDKLVRIAIVRRQVPPDADKLWDRQAKCRAQAMGTTFPEEKETAVRMALGRLDKIVVNMTVPTFEAAHSRLDAKIQARAAVIAQRAAAAAEKAAARVAARAAARAAGISIPKVPTAPRPVVVPPPRTVWTPPSPPAGSIYADASGAPSPYQTGSARDIMFRKLAAGWCTIPEILAAAVGTADHPDAVFAGNFYPRRNKYGRGEKAFKWEVLKEGDKLKIVLVVGQSQ
jgi:hypothetical protein